MFLCMRFVDSNGEQQINCGISISIFELKKSLFLNHNITILPSYYTMEKTKFASPYHYLKAADIFNLSLFIEKKRKHKINP